MALLAQQATTVSVDYATHNFGVSGQSTLQMLSDVQTQIDPLFDRNKAENIVLAWEGINDLFKGASASDAYSHLVSYCQGRRAVGFKQVIATILPKTQDTTFENQRQQVNSQIRANWQTFADYLIDVGNDATVGRFGDETNPVFYQADNIHLNVNGAAIMASYAKAAITYLSISDPGKPLASQNLAYAADGDANGLLYWLGTNYGRELWQNPVTAGRVVITASSLYDTTVNNHPEILANRDVNNFNPSFATSDAPNSSFKLDLGVGNTLQPTYYSLRGRDNQYHQPRSWMWLGSNDNVNYDTLDNQTAGNNGINGNNWLTLPMTASKSYRYFMLTQLGQNSSGANILTLGQWEFYGKFIHQ